MYLLAYWHIIMKKHIVPFVYIDQEERRQIIWLKGKYLYRFEMIFSCYFFLVCVCFLFIGYALTLHFIFFLTRKEKIHLHVKSRGQWMEHCQCVFLHPFVHVKKNIKRIFYDHFFSFLLFCLKKGTFYIFSFLFRVFFSNLTYCC